MDSILVPFELPDAESLSQELVDDLASVDVVLLGHYNLPEQTPNSIAEQQFNEEAQAELDELAEQFRAAGATVTTRLAFGKDRDAAIERVVTEEDCVAELLPAETEGMSRILVPIPDADVERLPEFVRLVYDDMTQEITLFHVAKGESKERGEKRLAKARDQLIEAGFGPDLVDSQLVEGSDHDSLIKHAANEYDAVVMYEATSRLGDFIFGSLPNRIRKATGDPVLVVRRDY